MRLKRSYLFLAVCVLPLLVVLKNSPLNASLHGISLTLLKPFLVISDSLVMGVSKSRDGLVRFWNTFQDQSQFQIRIAELESKLVSFEEVKRENERLNKLLGFKQTLSSKSIAAHVIGWNLSPWRKTVVLDKGKAQGIKKDMVVVVAEGLVGRVAEVGPTTSQAILLIDPDSRVSAIVDQSRAQGVVVGNGSRQLTVNYLDLDSGAAIGETVMTSGVGGLFPKGIGIGKIQSIRRDPNGLHLQVDVQSFVKFSKLEEVLCLAYSRAD